MNEQSGSAFGHPGLEPTWTTGAKEGFGTAYSASSRLWFTLSHGIVNEIYYPTIDRPQTRDFQFLVTDGKTFLHEERRLSQSTLETLPSGHGVPLGYTIKTEDPEGRYAILKEIISDPHQPCLLMNVRFELAPEWKSRLHFYVLLAPHLEGGGWKNSVRRCTIDGRDILVVWKGRTFLAFGASAGFLRTSCGFVGTSDGWQDLSDNFQMDWTFDRALDGNVAIMAEVEAHRPEGCLIGLAFGDHEHAAVTTLFQSLSVPFTRQRDRFIGQWGRVTHECRELGSVSGDGGRLFHVSHNLLMALEDKTYQGAHIASPSIPWGWARGDEEQGGYHLVWVRDLVNSAMGLLSCSGTENPRRSLIYIAASQLSDGGFPQNFWLDGTPHWVGVQLDQAAFPIILAWRLWKEDGLEGFDPYPMVRAAAGYLIRMGPSTEQERWEENAGYSPSTLASNIAALVCAGDFARVRGEEGLARFIEEYADFLESRIEAWTVTSRGTVHPEISRHYIRLLPAPAGGQSDGEEPDGAWIELKNQPPGESRRHPARDIVDAGFLELVRYGIRRPNDPLVEDSLRVVDHLLKVQTPRGPVWKRYNHDGYGETKEGGPFEGFGKGRGWPLLTGERGHYELAAGRDPRPYLRALESFATATGLLPEQVWDEDRPDLGKRMGAPTGGACPLAWAHAEYLRLVRSANDGRVFDLIDPVRERYQGRQRPVTSLEVWKPTRKTRSVRKGQTLRIMAPASFHLVWTLDGWKTVRKDPSLPSGAGVSFFDIRISLHQKAPVHFTFYWTEEAAYPFFRSHKDTWEKIDYEVRIV